MSTEPLPGPEHDFDFWLGEWEVVGPQGRDLGRSSITSLYGTGALAEHWRGAGGFEGRSLNAYDADRACWHQTWVDSSGGLLLLDGAFRAGAMVLTGTTADDSGVPTLNRITWTSEPGGVRQHWEASEDQGTTWTTVFDGHYRPAG